MIYVFWTCQNIEEARRIIHLLLEQKLIACASIFPHVESIYRWQGKIEEASETKIMLKTIAQHFDVICALIQKHCSYEVPEITQVHIAQAGPAYLAWVEQQTRAR